MNDTTRDEQLEDSMLGIGEAYKFYSVGRTSVLKKLGNPFFGGTPKDGDEWDMDRKLGVAWVIFTADFEEIDRIMGHPDPLKTVDTLWRTTMHFREQERIYNWIVKQAGLSEAAQTEAVAENGGKSGEQNEGTNPAG